MLQSPRTPFTFWGAFLVLESSAAAANPSAWLLGLVGEMACDRGKKYKTGTEGDALLELRLVEGWREVSTQISVTGQLSPSVSDCALVADG